MKQSESILASLPEDIALIIASCLSVGDLCALGSCSRFWRDLCGSDFLWESLTRQRWPSLDLYTESSSVDDHGDSSSLKGWRDFYVKWHAQMAERAMSVVQYAQQLSGPGLLEILNYLKAVEYLNSMQLGFKDVQMYLLRPEVNVLLNLVGLHYCRHWLKVPLGITSKKTLEIGRDLLRGKIIVEILQAGHVMEALQNSEISQRKVYVKSWSVHRTWDGYRFRDASSRSVPLHDLALPQENEILPMLHSTLPSMGSVISRFQYYIVLALPSLSRLAQASE